MSATILKSCCRVCLESEPVMIYVFDKVEEFDMTLAELLNTCGNLAIDSSDDYSKLICKDCTEELLMVAKFREKCKTSEETLSRIAESLGQTHLEGNTGEEEPILDEDVRDDELMGDIYVDDGMKTEIDMFEYTENESSIEPEHPDEVEDTIDMMVEEDIVAENDLVSDELESHELNTFTVVTNDDEHQEDIYHSIIEETLHPDILDNMQFVEEELPNGFSVNQSDALPELYPPTRFELGNVKVNFNCDFCGAGFMHLNNLNKHLLTHQDSSGHLFECKVCTMVFTCSIRYYKHVKSHHEDAPSDLPGAGPIDRIVHVKNDNNKRLIRRDHQCPHCEKGFASKSLLDTHIRTHTGERPFDCTQCKKSFTTRGGLDLHMRRHMGLKPYQCEICEKRFVETSNLRVHMRIHTGEKPHKCNRCPRSFSRVFLLQIHQRTHTGERPYTCTHCSKAFAQQGDLAAHRRIHTGERPHQCELCGKGFIKSSALTGHMRRHDKNLVVMYNKDSDELDVWSEDQGNNVELDDIIKFDEGDD